MEEKTIGEYAAVGRLGNDHAWLYYIIIPIISFVKRAVKPLKAVSPLNRSTAQNMIDNKKFEDMIARIQQLKKKGEYDLSLEEDLSIAVMNLISLEEHFYFTGTKTGDDEYFNLLNETRAIRKELLGRMIDAHEGETWCISKHLLAAVMRCIEVGTKYYKDGKKDDAKKLFEHGSKIFSLFWALRLKLISSSDLKKIGDSQLNKHDTKGTQEPWKLDDIVNKLVNCCDE